MSGSHSALSTGKLVTLVGGSGFIGRHLVQRLAREGWRVRVAVRRPNEVPELRVSGDVGQVQLVQANVRHPASIAAAVEGSDVVINLVGLLFQTGKQKFRAVHVEGARTVAEAAAAAGVPRLVHLSALGADDTSASLYAQTKAEGERAVSEAYPGATILRPSVVFGPDDGFVNRFGAMVRMMPVVPLIGFGKTKFQPIFINDLVDGFVAAIKSEETIGRTYELGGPEIMSFADVVREFAALMDRPRLFVPVPFWFAKMKAFFLSLVKLIRLRPLLTVDQVRLLQADNVVEGGEGIGTLADLGVTHPVTLSSVLPSYLTRFRKHGQFDERPTVEV